MPPSPKHGQVKHGQVRALPEKKKRRQNVACDSCRLRRVKCDMLALLTPPDSTRVMPPLPVLVRQNPDVSCSNCISKGIRCTTNQIVNPSKPNKGGKRIEEAKKMYGSEGLFLPLPTGGTAAPTTPSLTFTAPQSQLSPYDSRAATTRTSVSSASSSAHDLTDTNNSVPTSVNLSHTGFLFTTATQYPYQGSDLLNQDATTASGSVSQLGQGWTTEWSRDAVATSYGAPFADGVFDMATQPQATVEPPAWSTFMFSSGANTTYPSAQQRSYIAPSSSFVSSAGAVAPVPALPNLAPSSLENTLDGTTGVASASSLVSAESLATCTSGHPFLPSFRLGDDKSPAPPSARLPNPSPALPAVTVRSPSPSSIGLPQMAGKKRQLAADDDLLEIVRKDEDKDENDPWALWAKSSERENKIVRWTRCNNVGDELASRALGSELSRHLVQVYFSSVHLTLPALNPEAFYMSWQQAGERSDRMTPSQEVLCAVIEAWAARFSDHPVVLGMDPNKPNKNRKLLLATGADERDALNIDQSRYGQQRLRVCSALVERARKLIDQHGILRKPSLTGAQALALFTQLQHMTDHNPEAPEHLMETEMLHTMLVHQLHCLDDGWISDGDWITDSDRPVYQDGDPTTEEERRMRQRPLWWTVLVADAFWAAGTCSPPAIPEEDVEAALAWLNAINPKHMPATFNAMSFFMGSYHRVATITRAVASKLSQPCKRPGRVDVAQFCNDARIIWTSVRDLYEDINSKVEVVLSIAKEEIFGLSPVHQFCSIRLAVTYILLIMQQVIQQLLDFRKRIHEAYVYDYTVPSQAQPEGSRVSALNELHAQSIDILLANVRAQVPLFTALLPTGYMHGAAMIARVSIAAAQFLSEVPTNEQGYPNHTRGGVDWTWENKQAEVDTCVKALHQLGWAWADVPPVLKKIKMNMTRMTPSPETLLSYEFEAQNISDDAARQAERRDVDGRRDSQALNAVLEFWPPKSFARTLGGAETKQRAITGREAHKYGRELFQPQSPERNRSSGPTPSRVSSSAPSTASVTVDGASHTRPISNGTAPGSAEGLGWTGAAPRRPGDVPLASELVDLADFSGLTDAKLQADLESFIETLVQGMPDMGS
ncbi:hypothetical protein CspeluHIS016_0303740 [Cutaneotrichosporon spelunceum]|uniref:Zn(2)-C6 fungal-type domain-containing protein n=1 Tax=Cutaneotrichosporon spelunceum TaxID=1672016 RepID=A0AAD3TTH6_9TREE|nr:hypothetical protein CspeluHIS016_0303740 [Cutaneotrichosporon spelunceum]